MKLFPSVTLLLGTLYFRELKIVLDWRFMSILFITRHSYPSRNFHSIASDRQVSFGAHRHSNYHCTFLLWSSPTIYSNWNSSESKLFLQLSPPHLMEDYHYTTQAHASHSETAAHMNPPFSLQHLQKICTRPALSMNLGHSLPKIHYNLLHGSFHSVPCTPRIHQ